MIGDGLTKDLSSLHLIEDGTGRHADPSPLRVNRHRDTIGQSVYRFFSTTILTYIYIYVCVRVKDDGGGQSVSPVPSNSFSAIATRSDCSRKITRDLLLRESFLHSLLHRRTRASDGDNSRITRWFEKITFPGFIRHSYPHTPSVVLSSYESRQYWHDIDDTTNIDNSNLQHYAFWQHAANTWWCT